MNELETEVKVKKRIPFLRAFVGILMTDVQTKVIGLLIAGGIIFGGGALLFDRQSENAAADERREEKDDKIKAFELAMENWNDSKKTYDSCNITVDNSVDSNMQIRAALFTLADLTGLFPDSEVARLYTQTKQAEVDVTYPAIDGAQRKLERCEPLKPGDKPIDPRTKEDS